MTYKWIHPPLKLVEEYDETLPLALQITQDSLNDNEVSLYSFDIPKEYRKMYADELFVDTEEDARRVDEGEDVEPVEYVVGFFIGADADLSEPRAAEVFVYTLGPEREYPACFLPIGGHASGSYQPGDYLISVEDYLAISKGIYTPAVYTCQPVRDWDPHKALRPRQETA